MTIKIAQKIVGYSVSENSEVEEAPKVKVKKQKRPELLEGKTLKIKANGFNLYVTINFDADCKPLELFFNSSHLESMSWVALATRLGSMILRSTDPAIANLEILAKEFIKTETPDVLFGKVRGHKKGSTHNGVIQLIGRNLLALDKEIKEDRKRSVTPVEDIEEEVKEEEQLDSSGGIPCPDCSTETVLMDGCPTCPSCGWSKCS